MTEKDFVVECLNSTGFFGVNDTNIEYLRSCYPKLRIISRGNTLKVLGEAVEIEQFESTFQALIQFYEENHELRVSDIKNFLSGNGTEHLSNKTTNDTLLLGVHGRPIKARTINQRKLVDLSIHNDLVFAIGPAGTGKTYTAVALAVKALKNKEVRRIILTRPAVEAGENLGFLPGDLKDKLDPYLQPLYDALRDMIPHQKLTSYFEEGIIEIAPLAFMRGRTLDYAFAILDEAQNATDKQIKMFLTRMGTNSKFIVTGDVTQIDLPKSQVSGLLHAENLLKNIEGIGFVHLDKRDIIRHPLVEKIVSAYQENKESN